MLKILHAHYVEQKLHGHVMETLEMPIVSILAIVPANGFLATSLRDSADSQGLQSALKVARL